MSNTKQNNEIEHINKEISLLQDRLKINEKSKNLISKWVNGNPKNTSKAGTKGKSFSKQKNAKYSEEYISKYDQVYRKKG